MSEEKTFDEMREELIAAGYRQIEWSATVSAWRTPDGYDFEFAHASTPDILRVVTFAWKHLQQQRELVALRELAKRLIEANVDALAPNINWVRHAYNVLLDLKTEAKRVIGEE